MELVRAYLPTSRALQALAHVADGLDGKPHDRALALVGPYGSGKSAFALFLGALLSPKQDEARQTAADILHRAPLHLVVMLHQAFEHYSNRMGKHLREEWQKVQGRFATLAFLEPAEQSLAHCRRRL